MDSGEWTVVSRSRRKKGSLRGAQNGRVDVCSGGGACESPYPELPSDVLDALQHFGVTAGPSARTAGSWRRGGPQTEEDRAQHFLSLVHEALDLVKGSTVHSRVMALLEQHRLSGSTVPILEHVKQLVVYGLGSVEWKRVSRYQLALTMLLRNAMPILMKPPLLYDPFFTAMDKHLLQQLSMEVIPENERGARHTELPTLFFLPHCEAWLIDNLLCANWTVRGLCRLAILGNSFARYQAHWALHPRPPATLVEEVQRPHWGPPERLLLLTEGGAVREFEIPEGSSALVAAFNDTSLHFFTEEKLRALGLPEE